MARATQAVETHRAAAAVGGGSASVQQYLLADATVIQNSIGASLSGEQITIPGGTAATSPAAAGAVIYEWDLKDPTGTVIGALTGPLLGSLRISEVLSPGGSTDVVAVLYIQTSLANEGMGVGCKWSDATLFLGGAWGSNGGTWTNSDYTGADYRAVLGTWNLIQSDTGSAANLRVNQVAAHDYPGNTTANTRRSLQNLTFTNLGGTPKLRLAVFRTAGSAGDKTLELDLFSNVVHGA